MSLGVQVGRFAALILVTAAAIAVMLASQPGDQAVDDSQPSVAKLPPTVVSVRRLPLEDIPITDSYSGMLHPWERFQVGFDSAGRVISLGGNKDGEPLDDGDTVTAGQVLATLDQRMLSARVRETKAIKRRAENEWDRAQELHEVNPRAISDAILLTRQTEFEIASAQLEMAEEALDRSTLKSPVDGVISKRIVNVGEAVLPQQIAFEIIQDDRLLFTVGVPESKIRGFVERMAETKDGPDDFEVVVNLIGSNAKGRKPQTLRGVVRHVSRTSDDTSGMFTVETEIKNDGLTRSGQIGVGEFKLDVVKGYRMPATAAVVRNENLVLFHVDPAPVSSERQPQQPAAVRVGETMQVREFTLRSGQYIEQQDDLILDASPEGVEPPAIPRHVVVRGQHRLFKGSEVKIAELDSADVQSSKASSDPAAVESSK